MICVCVCVCTGSGSPPSPGIFRLPCTDCLVRVRGKGARSLSKSQISSFRWWFCQLCAEGGAIQTGPHVRNDLNKLFNQNDDPKPVLAGLKQVPFGILLRPADIVVLVQYRPISRVPATISPEGGRASTGRT